MTRSLKLANSMARSTVTFSSTFTEELCVATVRGIKNLLSCDGYIVAGQDREQSSINNIVDLFVGLDDAKAVKMVKYLTAIYLPMILGDDLPVRPDFLSPEATLFSSEYGRYIKRLFQCEPSRPSRRAISLATSILQLKRYLPPLSKKLKKQAQFDCRERLTAIRSTPSDVLDYLTKFTTSLFPLGWDKRPGPFSITNKSCFESSRANGGAQAYMFEQHHPLNIVQPSVKPRKSIPEMISSTIRRLENRERTLKPNVYPDVPFLPPLVIKEKHPKAFFENVPYHPDHDYELVKMDEHGELRGHPLRSNVETYTQSALDNLPEVLRAKMEIVEDPLKARVITKNNWQCTILKPLQKMVHARMRDMPFFELIGKPVSPEVIQQIPLFEGSKWVSGDYEAATDNLNADCTNVVLKTILSNMTGPMSRKSDFVWLAANSLTDLWIFGDEVGWFKQTNGQLMGSLLSFPILCMVNMAMWSFTCEKYYGTIPTGVGLRGKWDNVRINGDDIAFAATPEQYNLWKDNVALTGLKPSLGKNYFSNRMVTLNSQPFIYSKDLEGRDILVQVKWLNQGLLMTPTTDDDSDPIESLGSMHDDFVKGSGDPRYASGIFIKEHCKLLRTTFRNLFGPREYGGLGAHPVKGTKGVQAEAYDLRQLYVAKLLQEGKIRLPSRSAQTQYTHYIESYVKTKFPNVVEGNLTLLETAPLGYRWEDVTERVDECRVDLEAAVSWLGPLLVRRKNVNDHHFLRSLMKQVEAKEIRGLPWDDYMSFPEETSLYQLMHDLGDSRLHVSFNDKVVQDLPELLGLPRNENGECDNSIIHVTSNEVS